MTKVAYLIFLMTQSQATLLVFPGLFIAKIFIIFDLLSEFQNALDQSKLTRYISFVFKFSSYIGFGNGLFIYNNYQQIQLRGIRITGWRCLLLLSLLTLSTISYSAYYQHISVKNYVLSQLTFSRRCGFTEFFCQADIIVIDVIYIYEMAIYHHCFDSPFLIIVVVSFVIIFVSSANIIPDLLLMTSKKTLTFTLTSREIFSSPRE